MRSHGFQGICPLSSYPIPTPENSGGLPATSVNPIRQVLLIPMGWGSIPSCSDPNRTTTQQLHCPPHTHVCCSRPGPPFSSLTRWRWSVPPARGASAASPRRPRRRSPPGPRGKGPGRMDRPNQTAPDEWAGGGGGQWSIDIYKHNGLCSHELSLGVCLGGWWGCKY